MPSPVAAPRQYQGRLLLFTAVAAATVVWFQRHVEPYVTETLIIGGTISLWGLWKLGWSIYEEARKNTEGEGEQDLTRKFLDSRSATRALVFAAVVVALLHACTASLYMRVGGGQPGVDTFRVQVLEKGNGGDTVFMGPFELHPGDVEGRPIFPSFRSHTLEYQILSPRGYQPKTLTLRPWGAQDLRVPGSFEARTLHLVVLVPDLMLFSLLPPPGQPGGDRYYLNVTIKGRTERLADYSQQLVVTGAASADLPEASEIAASSAVRQQVADHFAHTQVTGPERVVAALFDASIARLASTEAGEGEEIAVEVGTSETVDGESRTTRMFTCKLRAPREGTPQVRVIGTTLETGECK